MNYAGLVLTTYTVYNTVKKTHWTTSIFYLLVPLPILFPAQDLTVNQISYHKVSYPLYPEVLEAYPDIPSPLSTKDGREILIAFRKSDNRCTLMPVTVENGDILDYRYKKWWNKGRQLHVDSADFPTMAKTGLHSNKEFARIKTITGKSISEITMVGRPGRYSGAGFMSHDENIISVLKGDNGLVSQLGLTHPQNAKPLFHVFNTILVVKKDSERANIGGILYNGKKVFLKFRGSKGWQETIFNDEILGYWQIEIWRDLNLEEKAFISEKYSALNEEKMAELIKKLSYIHTGEMVPYYIMRYGFYEGHSSYRADPIAIAFIFRLLDIQEIERAFKGRLYERLTGHFIEE